MRTVGVVDVTIRGGTIADATVCGSIVYDAFRKISDAHSFPPDFPAPEAAVGLLTWILSNPEFYSAIAEVNGRVVGSNFLYEANPIAGVGPITIDPNLQDKSVGRRLMKAVLDRAAEKNFPGVRLVQAAYHMRSLSLYTKLGFVVREPLVCMQGSALGIDVPGYAVRAATEADLDVCNSICRGAHGHDRAGELSGAIKDGTAIVVESEGRATGYATLIGFFGHAVSETNSGLKALIGATKEFAGPGFLLPMRNHDLFRWCLERGLRGVQPMTLMSRGLYNEPGATPFLPSILY